VQLLDRDMEKVAFWASACVQAPKRKPTQRRYKTAVPKEGLTLKSLPDGGVVLCKVAEGSEPVLSRTARCCFSGTSARRALKYASFASA
jgi:hypothetical protein